MADLDDGYIDYDDYDDDDNGLSPDCSCWQGGKRAREFAAAQTAGWQKE